MSAVLMASPRLEPMTLVAPGTQVLISGRWYTVRFIFPCQMESIHGAMCSRFYLDDQDVGTHCDLSTEVWMRHPVGAR